MSSLCVPKPTGTVITGLLGPFIPEPPALILLSGESSAGKTVLCYNLAYCLAEGTEFVIGLSALRPIKVLYIDLESNDSLHQTLVETVGRSKNLHFAREIDGTLAAPARQRDLVDAASSLGAALVVVDPLPMAWPSKDENDNAEADAQMSVLKGLAVDTGAIILALWNQGEGNPKEKFKARGATARIDRADIALNYSIRGDGLRELKIVKSRFPGTLGLAIGLKFSPSALAFERTNAPSRPITDSDRLKIRIPVLVASGVTERKDLVEQLAGEGFKSAGLVDQILHQLTQDGTLRQPKRGSYKWHPSTGAQSTS